LAERGIVADIVKQYSPSRWFDSGFSEKVH